MCATRQEGVRGSPSSFIVMNIWVESAPSKKKAHQDGHSFLQHGQHHKTRVEDRSLLPRYQHLSPFLPRWQENISHTFLLYFMKWLLWQWQIFLRKTIVCEGRVAMGKREIWQRSPHVSASLNTHFHTGLRARFLSMY